MNATQPDRVSPTSSGALPAVQAPAIQTPAPTPAQAVPAPVAAPVAPASPTAIVAHAVVDCVALVSLVGLAATHTVQPELAGVLFMGLVGMRAKAISSPGLPPGGAAAGLVLLFAFAAHAAQRKAGV